MALQNCESFIYLINIVNLYGSGTMLSDQDKITKKIVGQETALTKLERPTKKVHKARKNREWPNIL